MIYPMDNIDLWENHRGDSNLHFGSAYAKLATQNDDEYLTQKTSKILEWTLLLGGH